MGPYGKVRAIDRAPDVEHAMTSDNLPTDRSIARGSAMMLRPIIWGPIIFGVGVGAAIGNGTGNLVTGVGLGLMFGVLAAAAARKKLG